jgi:hypothetical protein
MLICPSNLEQFGQGVSKRLASHCLGWFKGSYEINKGMQNVGTLVKQNLINNLEKISCIYSAFSCLKTSTAAKMGLAIGEG